MFVLIRNYSAPHVLRKCKHCCSLQTTCAFVLGAEQTSKKNLTVDSIHSLCSSMNYSQVWNTLILRSSIIFRSHARGFSDFRRTIYALSSGQSKCGVAVVRITGQRASDAFYKLTKQHRLPAPRLATLHKLFSPETDEQIDKGLVLWFPAPRSFTGEDSVEFHVHGGPAVVSSLLSALGQLDGFQHAEPGDFTKRAFLNGKLDLTEVEGLGDLIHAETEAQRKQALRQMEGDLSKIYTEWRQRLVKCTANIEAYIDFGEDENIEDDVLENVCEEVEKICQEIYAHMTDSRKGERLRNGVHVAIIGEPNVGKSSLLNIISQRPAAIVSPIPGTTRDVVETAVNLSGYPVLVSDTAGLRETDDIVEKEGVRRAIARGENADIKIVVTEAASFLKSSRRSNIHSFIAAHLKHLGFTTESRTELFDSKRTKHTDSLAEACDKLESFENIILVLNKIDLLGSNIKCIENEELDLTPASCISCTTGHGVNEFLEILKDGVTEMCGNPSIGNPSLTQTRYRTHLTHCCGFLMQFQNQVVAEDIVLAAQELRNALREIGRITGKITSEDILDVIFRDFCIGK